MNIVNLNTKLVNPVRPTAAQEQYQLGWDRFTAGELLPQWGSDEERRGWWAALQAAADADTYRYLNSAVRS